LIYISGLGTKEIKGNVYVLNNIKYKVERPYDYYYGEYYYVKEFDLNGNRMYGSDTIYINDN